MAEEKKKRHPRVEAMLATDPKTRGAGRKKNFVDVNLQNTIARLEKDVRTYDMLIRASTPSFTQAKEADVKDTKQLRSLISERTKIMKEVLVLKKLIPAKMTGQAKKAPLKPIAQRSNEELIADMLAMDDE